jgi:hypothetical protein
MKTDYIYDMPAGKEIDEMVAEKVMGWHKGNYIPSNGVTIKNNKEDWLDADGRYMHGIKQEDGWYEDDDDFHLLHWHPSQSILWAWEVIEKIKDSMLSITIERDDDMVWACILISNIDNDEEWYLGEASTPELAICYASLLAMEHIK